MACPGLMKRGPEGPVKSQESWRGKGGEAGVLTRKVSESLQKSYTVENFGQTVYRPFRNIKKKLQILLSFTNRFYHVWTF